MCVCVCVWKRERERRGERQRQTQRDTERDRQTDIQTEPEREWEREREREREMHTSSLDQSHWINIQINIIIKLSSHAWKTDSTFQCGLTAERTILNFVFNYTSRVQDATITILFSNTYIQTIFGPVSDQNLRRIFLLYSPSWHVPLFRVHLCSCHPVSCVLKLSLPSSLVQLLFTSVPPQANAQE